MEYKAIDKLLAMYRELEQKKAEREQKLENNL